MDVAHRGTGRVFEGKRTAQPEYDLLSRLEQGESVFLRTRRAP